MSNVQAIAMIVMSVVRPEVIHVVVTQVVVVIKYSSHPIKKSENLIVLAL
ncbi:hypothetical protein ABRP32_11360 [Providencia manganoxydans]